MFQEAQLKCPHNKQRYSYFQMSRGKRPSVEATTRMMTTIDSALPPLMLTTTPFA
jgi:hypothetical protein